MFASNLVDGVVTEVVKVVIVVIMNLEINPVVVGDSVVLIVDSVIDKVDSAIVVIDSMTVVIDCVVVVVDFVVDIVDSMFDADCMTRHPRSKNEQINLIMQEFTRHGLFRM